MTIVNLHDPYGYGLLLEQIIHQNDVLIENIGEMRDLVARIPFIEAKVLEHDKRFDTLEAVIKTMSLTVNDHEVRISKLETDT